MLANASRDRIDNEAFVRRRRRTILPFLREVSMALTAAQLEQQKQQAEELLFSGPQTLGFAKGLFFGHFNAALLNPYPHVRLDEQSRVNEKVDEVRHYCEEHIDAVAIDRNAEIPTEVVSGLGHLGVLGATAPAEYGGLGLS